MLLRKAATKAARQSASRRLFSLLLLVTISGCEPEPEPDRPATAEQVAKKPEPAKPPPPPRVILISLDTHAMNAMSLVEADPALDTNPALRKLAQQPGSVLFTHAFGVSSWTKPTHATVFTGLYPSQHGQVGHTLDTAIVSEHPTLHEQLHDAGARTIHLASHLRLDDRHGYRRGTDEYAMYDQPFGKRGQAVLDDAIEILREHPDGPLFMFLHLFDAHAPYTNYPEGYRAYYSGPEPDGKKYYRTAPFDEMLEGDRFPAALAKNREQHAAALDPKMPGSRAAYRLGIRDVDDMLARFLKRLEGAGQLEDTTLIFFADHGEEFFEHGMLTHFTLYQQNVRVPVLIKLAKGAPHRDSLGEQPRVIDHTFEAHTTLNRVVLSLFGLTPPEHVRKAGTRAVPLPELLELNEDREVFAETYHLTGDAYEAMLLSGGQKLHVFLRLDEELEIVPGADRAFQLFDLRADPEDARDLYARRKARIAPLQKRLVRSARAALAGRQPALRSMKLSKEERERLRALGYAQ